MQALLRIAVASLVTLGVTRAQPLLDREELRKIPLSDAVVIDPVGRWALIRWANRPGYTNQSGLAQQEEHARLTVAEGNMQAGWSRELPIAIDTERYPILVLNYRATGLQPSEERLLLLGNNEGNPLVPLLNRDLVCDGELQEAVIDLRELAEGRIVTGIDLYPHCRGPEPAVLDVCGIRFEAAGELPPAALPEEANHTIRMVDTEGRAVPGALVTIEPDYLNLARSVRTDTDGRATLRMREFPGSGHALRVEKDGMGTVESVAEAGQPLPTALAMRRGIRYGGTVRNEEGDPVPYASVAISTRPYSLGPRYRGRTRADALADSKGRWLTPVLWAEGNPRESQASAHPWHRDYYVGNWTWIPAGDDAAMQRIELTLRQGIKLAGRVVGPLGQPVAGVELRLVSKWFEDRPERVVTNTAGRFAFSRWARDDRILMVRAEGFAAMARPIYLTPGMEEPTIRLAAENLIWGRVEDTAGRPLAGVQVKAEGWGQSPTALWEGTTNAEGQFVWDTAPDRTVHSRFAHEGHMTLDNVALRARDEIQTIVLPPVLRVHGTIIDVATGKPVPGCTVIPGKSMTSRYADKHAPLRWFWNRRSSCQATGGRYEVPFDHVRPSEQLALRIEAKGYLPAVMHPIATGPQKHRLDIEMQRGEKLMCMVRLPDGGPAAGARVYLVPPKGTLDLRNQVGEPSSAKQLPLTGAAGRYQFPPSAGRGYLVAIHEHGYLEMDARQAKGMLDVRLKPWGSVAGVSMVGSQPAPFRNVVLTPDPPLPASDRPEVKHSLWVKTDAKGRFGFDRVPPGRGMVRGPRVSSPSHRLLPGRQTGYEVAAGKTTQVVFGGTGRPVIGRLAFAEGSRPSFGWRLGMGTLTAGDSSVYHFPIKQDGSFRIEDIPAGQYELRIDFRSLVPGDRAVEHPLLGDATHSFTIPKMPGGRSDEPLDLGTLTPTLTPQ